MGITVHNDVAMNLFYICIILQTHEMSLDSLSSPHVTCCVHLPLGPLKIKLASPVTREGIITCLYWALSVYFQLLGIDTTFIVIWDLSVIEQVLNLEILSKHAKIRFFQTPIIGNQTITYMEWQKQAIVTNMLCIWKWNQISMKLMISVCLTNKICSPNLTVTNHIISFRFLFSPGHQPLADLFCKKIYGMAKTGYIKLGFSCQFNIIELYREARN